MIDYLEREISVRRQCELVGLNRSTLYYAPARESELNLELMRLIDAQYMLTPFYGWPKMTAHLRRLGYAVNHKRVQRLMHRMGLQALYPKPHLSNPDREQRVYPYLLKDLAISRPNQVWSADITYVPMHQGFMYLTAIIDWFSRYVIAWEVSNTLDARFCLKCLREALATATPEIFNTDQGVQFTSEAFTSALHQAGVRISMDGRGRALDNIFVERLWRSVKYEDIYLQDYATGRELIRGLRRYFHFYNFDRPHQSLDYQTPAEVHLHPRWDMDICNAL
jgi:putative transposase